jgi:molybdate transport repressor ModE-like protein
MDWNDIRYLLALSRRGSLAKAAVDLGVTKATASRRLDALEEALGTTLVERRAAGFVLTEAGADAVRAGEEMERAAATLRERVAARRDDVPSGVVRLTAPPWLADKLIIPALPRFRERYPELEVRLLESNRMLDMVEREADLALRNVIPASGPLFAQRVGELAGCIYGSDLYLARRGEPRSREDLLEHDLVAYEMIGGMPGFEWIADPSFASRVAFRAVDPAGLCAAIGSGLGLGAIPCVLGETDGRLRRIEALGVGYSPLYLVAHEEMRDVARVKAVRQLVGEVLRENVDVLMGGR